MLGQTFYPIVVDFKDYEDKGSRVRIPVSALMKKISVQLNQTTKLLTIRPDTVEFIYTKGKAKKVPVKLQGKVALDRQYYISDIIYSPDSVMVYAPQEILDTITAAYTQALNFEDVADTIRRRVNLADVRGAKFIPSFDDVTLLVDIYAEKSVEVPIRGINFRPTGTSYFSFQGSGDFSGRSESFKSITSEDFFIGVTYESLLNNKGGEVSGQSQIHPPICEPCSFESQRGGLFDRTTN